MSCGIVLTRGAWGMLLAAAFWPAAATAQNAISTGTKAGFRMFYPGGNDWWLDPSQGRFDVRGNGGSPIISAVVAGGGQVGIAVPNPQPGVRLDVNGDIHITSGTGGSGYFGGGRLILEGQTAPANISGTGFAWHNTPNGLFLINGNNYRANFDLSGNLGIGTTAPAGKLDVEGGYSYLGGLRVNGGDKTATIWQQTGAGTLGIYAQDGTMFLQPYGGNVGIGTTNPLEALGLGNSGKILMGTGADNGGDVQVSKATDVQFRGTRSGGADGYVGMNLNALDVRTVNAFPIQLYTNNVTGNGMIINQFGSVGIGTTNPRVPLHVASGGNPEAILQGNSAGAGLLFWDGSGNQTARFGVGPYIFSANASADVGLGSEAGGKLNLGTNGNNVRLTIDVNGNVGIGTTNPVAPLQVNGGIIVSGCTGCGSGTSPWLASGSNVYYNGGNVGIGVANPGSLLHVGNNNVAGVRIEGPLAAGTGAFDLSIGGFGQVRVDANGVTGGRLTLTEGGNLGLGSNAPQAPLHIKSAAAGIGPSVILENSGNASGSRVFDLVNNSGSAGQEQLDLRLLNDAGTGVSNVLAAFRKDGYVGIGTTAPGYPLTVSYTGSSGTSGIVMISSGSNNFVYAENDTGGGTVRGGVQSLMGQSIRLGSVTNWPTELVENNSVLMTLATNGNVGIGIGSPKAALHLSGLFGLSGLNSPLSIQNNPGADLIDFDFNALGLMGGSAVANPGRSMRFDNRANQPAVAFWTRPAGTPYPAANELAKLAIMENGNVGVGNVSPQALLDVSGNARASRLLTGDGNLAAPAHAFIGEPGTGFYRATTNQLAVSVAGSQQAALFAPGAVYLNPDPANNDFLDLDLTAGVASLLPRPDGVWQLGRPGSTPFGWSRILTKNGSAASPAYTFSGDATAGIYYGPASNQIGFATNGIEALDIDGSGRVYPADANVRNGSGFGQWMGNFSAGHDVVFKIHANTVGRLVIIQNCCGNSSAVLHVQYIATLSGGYTQADIVNNWINGSASAVSHTVTIQPNGLPDNYSFTITCHQVNGDDHGQVYWEKIY